MKKNLKKLASCLLAGTIMVSSSVVSIYATPLTGMTDVRGIIVGTNQVPVAGVSTIGTVNNKKIPVAGISLTLSDYIVAGNEQAVELATAASEQVSENEAPVVASEYTDIAIAQVDNYVNVRSEPNTESEVLGKLYNNSAATVLQTTEDGWYQITSGNVTGYVKAEYVVTGDEELAKAVSTKYAMVTTETLYVRTDATTESGILTMLPEGDDFVVIDDSMQETGWVKVTTEEGDGFVSMDYVSLHTEYVTAESKEEEEARLAKEKAEREAAAAAAAAATRKASTASTSTSTATASASTSYVAPSGSDGQSVANYASQFVGNPYVYGGTSLTNGADCSGFVMSVYASFGISLPHSSSGMRSVGYEVSASEMQPGDIVCYSGHVAIYVGNDTIVHASTRSTGIKYTSPAAYKKIICVRRIF